MLTATGNSSTETVPVSSSASRHMQSAVAGVLLIAAFWPILVGMYGSWFDPHSYMEHGILVIPAAAYMSWSRRAELARIRWTPWPWSLVILAWGAAQATFGVAAHWMWVSRTAFLVSLTGCIAAIYGWRMVRALAYPLGSLLLMIAPPTFIFERLTLNLQLLASRIGEACLEALGYSVMREGNILELVGTRLSVEEACSGIRSLLAILFVCVLYNHFFVRERSMRAAILILAAPVAILGNAGRIVATGIASQYNPALIEGTTHEAFGYVSVALAGIGCVMLHLVILYLRNAWRSL